MALQKLVTEYIKKSPAYKAYIENHDALLKSDGLDFYPLSRAVKLWADKRRGRLFAILPTEEGARSLFDDLSDTKDVDLVYLPTDGKMLYSSYSQTRSEIERRKALDSIASMQRGIVVSSLRAFVSPLLSEDQASKLLLTLAVGDRFDAMGMAQKLSESGYFRVPNCYEEGTFSLRGEVFDIYPYSHDYPIRIYADWDTVDRISTYDTTSQKTKESLQKIRIPLIDSDSDTNYCFSTIKDYLKDDDYFVLSGMERIATSWYGIENEARSRYKVAYSQNIDAPLPDRMLFDWKDFSSSLKRGLLIYDISQSTNFHFDVSPSRSYFGNASYFKDDVASLLKNKWQIFVVAPSQVQKERLDNFLKGYDVDISVMNLSSGFQIEEISTLVVLDQEIFGRRKQRARATIEKVESSPLDSFVELKEGDYVVHVNYGIGQFVKIDRVKTTRTERDYIKIKYANEEYLYVPIEQANLVQKFIGNDARLPKLDTIGSNSWTKKKEKAMKNAQELASELVRLYAQRQNSFGYPFAKDNDWQIQFEASFPFTETPDQIKCIDEIKKDMESDKVMDRLVCGDVGYGKTEIAFRASFKAVMSGKQVAFLAPTVILAEQHYENFISRLGSFPVKASILTRFVKPKEQRAVMAGLEEGKVDVLFGTHKILSKELKFKNLGLLVVDEEQRFGVKAKEKIKQMKTNIDCLSLSATPIPRTLYMSLLKVRDMSLLTTAPRERLPIETKISQYNLSIVTDAIKRELERGGQVFYLHNRIDDLEDVAQNLRAEIPSAIIETAHGRMDAEDLEDVMHRFIYEGVQVLVSTTIIENGIDIPNVNTIIIDRADRLGLSQLYQLRGRVGRSDKKAYCYLLYPNECALNDDAIKRLRVLSENTDLGSGFKIAMKDMEIRGAGNILGREQSGHLEAVGLDMYMRLLEEEIDKLTNGNEQQRDVLLELDYTGFIPDSYISDPVAKFEMYKKIASIATEGQLESLRQEAENRFGSIPEEVDNLFCIAEIKIICKKLAIYHLSESRGIVQIEFSNVSLLNPDRVISLMKLSNGKVTMDAKRMNYMKMETSAISLKDKALFILEQLRRLI